MHSFLIQNGPTIQERAWRGEHFALALAEACPVHFALFHVVPLRQVDPSPLALAAVAHLTFFCVLFETSKL
jgi:hypothetical protein